MKALSLFLTLVCCASLTTANAQESFYLYDKDWNPTTENKNAAYFMQLVKQNDTTYICRYYNYNGPMIRLETYRDQSLETPMGLFAWYNRDGRVDSTGYVNRGRKDGYWRYMSSDSGKLVAMDSFSNGKLRWRNDYEQKTIIYADGRTEALWKDTPRNDTLIQKEPEFKGGMAAWKKYLVKTMKTPERIASLTKGYRKETVVVDFKIDKQGDVTEPEIFKSAEWSVDMEALRVIRNSPRWTPASINGRAVIYRQRQSLTFVVDEG